MAVAMTMVQVGIMRVPVHHRRVAVPMRMRLSGRIARLVIVLVVLVMDMTVLMFERLVRMVVIVSFDEVEIEADPHQQRCEHELHADGFPKQRDREQRADEWRG